MAGKSQGYKEGQWQERVRVSERTMAGKSHGYKEGQWQERVMVIRKDSRKGSWL
jgi:hypothetical protein